LQSSLAPRSNPPLLVFWHEHFFSH
jgi:hypothetical protein